jgi:hypothetical protein
MEYMHLIGVEQIQSAANTMRDAAHEMHRSANTIHDALQRHGEIMREFMDRMDTMLNEEKPTP